MNDYSSTHYNFVDRPRQSNTSRTVDKAVIRNDTGNLQVRQCNPKIKTVRVDTLNKRTQDNKTVGDILNRLKFNNQLRNITRGI